MTGERTDRRFGEPIPGFPGYSVTRTGAVYSHFRGRPRRLRLQPHHAGHRRVQLRLNGRPKSIFAHVAVALTYIGPPPFEGARVLHRDGNPRNNRPANLRWGTLVENARDMVEHGTRPRGESHGCAALSRDAVLDARNRRARGVPARAIASDYGVDPSTVLRAVRGETWGHIPQGGSQR